MTDCFDVRTLNTTEGSCAIGKVSSSLRLTVTTSIVCTNVQKSSSSQLTISCQVPLAGELFFNIGQISNHCDTAYPDTSCNQVFGSRIPSSALEHLSTRANSTSGSYNTPLTMMTLHPVGMQSNHFIRASDQTEKPRLLKTRLFIVIVTSTDQDAIEKGS